jgi:hypothetical protein
MDWDKRWRLPQVSAGLDLGYADREQPMKVDRVAAVGRRLVFGLADREPRLKGSAVALRAQAHPLDRLRIVEQQAGGLGFDFEGLEALYGA